jgi:hypothetical protein
MKRQIVIALAVVFIILFVGTTFLYVATTPAAAYVGPVRPGIGVGIGVGVRPGIGVGAPGYGWHRGLG